LSAARAFASTKPDGEGELSYTCTVKVLGVEAGESA
jgi:hypothetical protein